MKRSYIYIIVVLLTISLVTADFIIGRDLKKIIPLDETYRTVEDDPYVVKEATIPMNLTIKNEQNTDDSITYKYTIKVKDVAGAYRYTYNNVDKYMVFTANGEASFELKSNESIIIYNLPVDAEYTIIQLTVPQNYKVKVNQVEQSSYSGTLAEGESITFNNSTIHEDNKKPAKEDKKEEPKKEEPKKEEEKKEDNKPNKKDIPNTGETEIKMVAILLISLLIIYCIRKIKIKRFE